MGKLECLVTELVAHHYPSVPGRIVSQLQVEYQGKS